MTPPTIRQERLDANQRGALLVWLSVRALIRRIVSDFGRELTVALSSSVILATFAYVFHDFLDREVSTLSAALRQSLGAASTVLLMLAAFGAGLRAVRSEIGSGSWRTFAAWIGEQRAVTRASALTHAGLVLALIHGAAWWLADLALMRLSPLMIGGGETLLVLATAARLNRRATATEAMDRATTSRELWRLGRGSAATRRRLVLSRWRWSRILLAQPVTKVTALWALPFLLLLAAVGHGTAPLALAVLLAFAIGILAAAALAFAMAEDASRAWVERSLGVSHEEYLGAWELVALRVALTVGLAAALAYVLGQWLAEPTLDFLRGDDWASGLSALGKVFVIAGLPALLAPMMMLQVDGRRPAVILLLTIVAALFLATAVYAHWLSLALVPLLRGFAHQSQAGRFYRP